MARLPWFRLFTEARTDAKLAILDDAEHRVWFNLLCFAADQDSRGTLAIADRFVLAAEVSLGDEALLDRAIAKLVKLRIVSDDGHAISFLAFRECFDGPSTRPSLALWREIRARIFQRDDYTCRYCGRRGGRLECDHVIPVSRGGSSDDDNLTTACKRCNRSKRHRLLAEWRPLAGGS